MRLRFLFAAALFLSFGIAFAIAMEPADERTRRDTIYPFRNPTPPERNNIFARYFFDNDGNNTLTIILNPYIGITETEKVQSLYSAGYISKSKPRNSSDEDVPLSDVKTPQSDDGSGQAETETAAPAGNRVVDEDCFPVYDFSIPFDESITEEIGFTGLYDSDDENELGFLRNEDKDPDDSQQSENGPYSFLVFEKKAFHNSPNRGQILFGGDYKKKFKKIDGDDDENSVPFALPLSMLFLAIGTGILLTMFTSTGKKEF